MLKVNHVLLFVVVLSFSFCAQTKLPRSPYISLHSGMFISAVEDFDKTYDSKAGLVYGLGFGLPVSSRSYIYAKGSIFTKSGTPVVRTYSFTGGTPVVISEKREGTADYKQYIVNAGFMYNFFLSRDWTLGVNAGVSACYVDEQAKSSASSSMSYTSGIFGFFAGCVIEKNFEQSPFSVFFEPQYNFTRSDVLRIVGNYGGMNLNAGVRYYFKERRLE